MITAIMQPYFFPYIGYFQLMRAADVFVLYDDAQFMKGGWINRNRILLNGRPHWITLSVKKASIRDAINKRWYRDVRGDGEHICRVLSAQYSSAPYYRETVELVAETLAFADSNVARFNANLLRTLARAMGLTCRIVQSSDLARSAEVGGGQQRVIEICRLAGAHSYLNPVSGALLYDAPTFRHQGISLRFLQPAVAQYEQHGDPFCASLSIIDVLMFNPVERVTQMLDEYRIVDSPSAAGGQS